MTHSKVRLRSLDALRGFDMIWLLGAEGIFAAFYAMHQNAITAKLVTQFEHTEWHGFTFYDLIFPLFIFLSGATLGLAQTKFKDLTFDEKRQRYFKALKRVFLLCLFGILYNHGWGQGIPANVDEIRFASVLMRIGFAWFFCAIIVWHFSIRSQAVIVIIILISYWLFQQFVPTPDGFVGKLNATQSWNAWLDSNFLIGATYQNKVLDPEGVFSQIPAAANALAGALVTRVLIANEIRAKLKTAVKLFVVGTVCIIVSWLWSYVLPFNKVLWTSSFSLLTIGLSCQFLSIFYWLFDVNNLPRTSYFFVVIGVNSILLYLLTSLFNWSYLVESFIGQLVSLLPAGIGGLISIFWLVLFQWILAHWLYKKNIFLKI